jgi:hypothetical protein
LPDPGSSGKNDAVSPVGGASSRHDCTGIRTRIDRRDAVLHHVDAIVPQDQTLQSVKEKNIVDGAVIGIEHRAQCVR